MDIKINTLILLPLITLILLHFLDIDVVKMVHTHIILKKEKIV